MSFLNLNEKEIKDQVRSFAKEELGLSSLKPSGVLTAIIEFLALSMAWLYSSLVHPLYANVSLDGAGGFFLDMWARMLGVNRLTASVARLEVSGEAYSDGQVEAGTFLRVAGTKLRIKILEGQSFTAGDFTLMCEAEIAGTQYNNLSGSRLEPLKVITGVERLELVDGYLLNEGLEQEKDNDLRTRIKALWLSVAEGKAPLLYKIEAEKIDGVIQAVIQRTPDGVYGRTRVILKIAEGSDVDGVITAVDNHLRLQGLAANELIVIKAREKIVNCEVRYSGALNVEEMGLILNDYIASLDIGENLQIRSLYELVKPLALDSFEVLEPRLDQELGLFEDLIAVTFEIVREEV